MTRLYFVIRIVTIVVLCLVSGCSRTSIPNTEETLEFTTRMPSSVPSSSPTCTAKPNTPTPTLSPTLTPTLTRTPIPTRTATATPLPTRTINEQRDLIVDLLETNNNCKLPCWWGITPGQSSYQDTVDSFWHNSFFVLDMPHPNRLFDYSISVDFTEQNGSIESIEVNSEVMRGMESEIFAKDWYRYAPEYVLNEYGIPSHTSLHLMPLIEANSPTYYTIRFVYDSLGISISYTGPVVYEPPIMRICPRFEAVYSITLITVSPQSVESLLEYRSDRTIEDVTNIDTETLHSVLKDPYSDVCFESPISLWP